ncbi:TPA: XRE family transcriptional regulator [Pseudomonas aeruginosa]|uniref:helix-turn-helix domain-containing protein n=1 Tax=Pseudomonas aeruginosa TaxID=287 RepID=UPI00068C70D3|nr:XRE family transcriptional regulator [Pseudomonas aeruginosa]HBO1237259.1 XRE family transcriptional regulator [Pseudomonas aeruginosa]HBO1875732.1 XRE family transcriptional regulator [Pseudomonas aeruginosa]HBO2079882.1 XRE family transcriptional regulator [Pseudomonas aeruginosa]HCH7472706.1 XRE family transcriptional regulator [Pseudomonas aeruginosa]HCH7802491.1 XRE family transcriptional regulator [Pseudomonas aeruginosa]
MLQKSIVTVPDQGDIEIHHSSGNVYADLEFPDADAMLAKAQYVAQLDRIIRERQWSPEQAASVVGLPASELSQILRGQFRPYQVDHVTGWLNKARDAAQWQE